MGFNLMESALGSTVGGHELPANIGQIEGNLTELENLLGTGTTIKQSVLDTRIHELKQMKQQAIKAEKEAYKKLGVNSILELSQRIKEINSQLLSFSNKALRRMPITKQFEAIDDKTVIEAILNNKIIQEMRKNIELDYVDAAADYLVQKIEETRKQTEGTNVKKGYIKNLAKEMLNSKGTTSFPLKGYKKELEMAFELRKSTYHSEIIITADVPEKEVKGTLSYYPYAFLTPQEKEEAKKDANGIYKIFINGLASCAGTYKDIAERVLLTKFTPEDFFIESKAQFIGILGEVQTTIILAALTDGQDNFESIKFFGNELEKGKKIGVDVAFENIGIQVKNYSIQNWRGISLSESITMETFLDKLIAAGAESGAVQDLGTFYSIWAYHDIADEFYGEIYSQTSTLEHKIRQWLQGYASAFLRLEDFTIDGLNLSNVFYFIGGEEIVPISFILGKYIGFLNKLKNGQTKKGARIATFVPTIKNKTSTYKNYYFESGKGRKDPYSFEGYGNIFEKLWMNVNVKIELPLVQTILKE